MLAWCDLVSTVQGSMLAWCDLVFGGLSDMPLCLTLSPCAVISNFGVITGHSLHVGLSATYIALLSKHSL